MERERQGEKHQYVVTSCVSPTGDLAHNPGMCHDWALNWQPFGLQAGAQSTEPHQPGWMILLLSHHPFSLLIPCSLRELSGSGECGSAVWSIVPIAKGSLVQFPVRACAQVAGSIPRWGHRVDSQLVFLCLSSLPSPLNENKINFKTKKRESSDFQDFGGSETW